MDEFRERLKQGWTYREAQMGKGWQDKYPHIARWQGGYSTFYSDGLAKISLIAASGGDFQGFATTVYTLAETQAACPTEEALYSIVDEFIRTWQEEHGEEAVLRFRKGWLGEPDWESRYPNIAGWIQRGKRYCIRVNINCVTGQSDVKAWHYDKPSNTETVLIEEAFENSTEQETLQLLDRGIQRWLSQNDIPMSLVE